MQLGPDQVELIFRFVLPTLKNEHQITSRILRAVPVDKQQYRPDPVSRSAFELASHIAAAENMFLRGIADGQFDSKPAEGKNTVEIADWYEAEFERNVSRLKPLSGAELSRILSLGEEFQFPAFAYLTFAINHSIHHRGQLSTYLRSMGTKVPSIYGKSYDDANA